MCVHFKYGGLSRGVTGTFKPDVFKGEFTSINLSGSGTIVHASSNEGNSPLFCKTPPPPP